MIARILVTGSRSWTDREVIYGALAQVWGECRTIGVDALLVHGACSSGADALADQVWQQAGLPVEPHPADWRTHGKSAGFQRNQEMVDLGAALCLAFIKDGSRGATHCAAAADRAGIIVRRYLA